MVIRRFLRVTFRLGFSAGLLFALFKLVQSRRSGTALARGSGWRKGSPVRGADLSGRPAGETPLVELSMLKGVQLKRGEEPGPPPPAAATPVTEQAPANEPSKPATATKSAAQKSAAKKSAATKKSAAQKLAAQKSGATKSAAKKSPAKKSVAKKSAATKSPARKSAAKKSAAKKSPAKKVAKPWVDPQGSFCPSSHPVKAKLSSGIFHLPGMSAYERTNPDRCYRDEDTAQSDGLRKAKR